MNKQITLDFGNIVHELENSNIKLCLIKNRSWFIVDEQENLYQIETDRYGSYLDNLIKNSTIVKFNLVDTTYINEWEKETWGIPEVEDFIKRQSVYWN